MSKQKSRIVKRRSVDPGILRHPTQAPEVSKMETNYDVLVEKAAPACPASAWPAICRWSTPESESAFWSGARAIGGTWDLFRPGHSLELGHVHLRLQVSAVARTEGAGRRSVDQALRHRRRANMESTRRSISASRQRRQPGRASDGVGRSPLSMKRAASHTFTCSYLVSCTGYYNHDEGYLPNFPGVEKFKAVHSSSEVARRTGLPRQTGHRHRKWGHCGDIGADHGPGHRAYHDAPALAKLRVPPSRAHDTMCRR